MMLVRCEAHQCLNGVSTERSSAFLWSSIPDAELLRLAESGQLNNEATLKAQTRRMLKDPKVSGFAFRRDPVYRRSQLRIRRRIDLPERGGAPGDLAVRTDDDAHDAAALERDPALHRLFELVEAAVQIVEPHRRGCGCEV